MADRITKLQQMTTAQLREQWQRIMDGEPWSNNRIWLYKRLAFGIQAKADGGLSARAQARLEELLAYAEVWMPPGKREPSAQPPPSRVRTTAPTAGTVLARAYKGRTLTVLVRDDGQFEFEGDLYPSLTAIAKAVTGSHWNGHHFFFGAKSKGRPA